MADIVNIDDLCVGYGGDDIVTSINFNVLAGEVFTIIGPNGSGKSTLIKALAGIVPSRSGAITLFGNNVTKMTAPQRISAGMSYVPQEFNVFRNMTIGENLKLSTEFLGMSKREANLEQDRILEMFPDIAVRKNLLAGNLSGGQRQMLAFASALISSPDVLLLDEPSAGLSPKLAQAIFEKVSSVNKLGTTVVMVEQNIAAALPYSNRVLVLVNGLVNKIGNADDIRKNANFQQLFLSKAD